MNSRYLVFFIVVLLSVNCSEKIEVSEDSKLEEQADGNYYDGSPNTEGENLVKVIGKSELGFSNPITFVFNDEGKLIKFISGQQDTFKIQYLNESYYTFAENEYSRRYFEVDLAYNITKDFVEFAEGGKSGYIYEYNEKNQLIMKEDLILAFVERYEYKENGNFIKRKYYSESNIEQYEYTKDSILVWHSWVYDYYDEITENDEYWSYWYNKDGLEIRYERRHFSDSNIFWFRENSYSENGDKQLWEYWIVKDFAINSFEPELYRYNGDTILSQYKYFDSNSLLKNYVFSTTYGSDDATTNTFAQVEHEFDEKGRLIKDVLYHGDFRRNDIEDYYGNFQYVEEHDYYLQKVKFDKDGIPRFYYKYDFELNEESGNYEFKYEYYYNYETDELIWYQGYNDIRRNPDGSAY